MPNRNRHTYAHMSCTHRKSNIRTHSNTQNPMPYTYILFSCIEYSLFLLSLNLQKPLSSRRVVE